MNKDLKLFSFIHKHIFVSENIASLLQKEKITGIEIIEQSFL